MRDKQSELEEVSCFITYFVLLKIDRTMGAYSSIRFYIRIVEVKAIPCDTQKQLESYSITLRPGEECENEKQYLDLVYY